MFWNQKIERIYFPVPSQCKYLTKTSKELFLASVGIESPEDKAKGLVEVTEMMNDEMLLLESLNNNALYRSIGSKISTVKASSFSLALVMNLILIISLVTDPIGDVYSGEKNITPLAMYDIMIVFGIFQIIFATLILVVLVVEMIPLITKRLTRQKKR